MYRCVSGAILALSVLLAAESASAGQREWWNGPYIGVSFGHGFGNLDGGITVLDPASVPYAHGPLNYSVDAKDNFGGIQLGINRQIGQLVVGIEADVQTSDIAGSSRTSFAPPVIFPFTYSAATSIDWFTTLRARLGLASNDRLIYVTGGLAVGDVNYNATYLITPNSAFAKVKSNETQSGYVLGAGVEQSFASNWSLKLEYQYINLGDQNAEGKLFFANGVPSGETVKTSFDTEIHTVRIGLNYRFHGQYEPLK
jgi:outer membrane immunogenic protein